MTRSELIENLVAKYPYLYTKSVDKCIKALLEQIVSTLENGGRVEVRGFGSFSLNYRQPRLGRNPKTGDLVNIAAKYTPHFRAGKDLKMRVDLS